MLHQINIHMVSLVLAFFGSAAAQIQNMGVAVNTPPPGKVFLSAWLDTHDPPNLRGAGDRPLKFTRRFGYNISSFQFAQDLPNPYSSEWMENQLEALGTDAIMYITVYPKPNPWSIADADIAALAQQCKQLNDKGRRVLIRLAPEFNGYVSGATLLIRIL